jgi:RNA recognition motif-containing protein
VCKCRQTFLGSGGNFIIWFDTRQRTKMEVKLYVGNLSFSTTEDDVRTLFAQAGAVSEVALIKDRDTGSSKGFAFVTMATQKEAENAIKMFNGYTLGNRQLKVNTARPREESSSPRGGFRQQRRY